MAAYAAVTSLMGTMHLISQSSVDFQEGNKECSKSLYEKVGSLLEFLDNSDNELMKDLQKKVKDLANEVEDEVLYCPSISRRQITDCPHGRRWVSVHSKRGSFSPILFDTLTHNKTRCLLFSSNQIDRCCDLGLVHFKLLRVLDLETMRLGLFPSEIVDLVSLRYLAVMVFGICKDLPISNLWNLQTFIFPQYTPQTGTIYLPNGIWELSQLRHLHSTRMYLCSPPKVSTNEVKYQVLENLLSVSGLSPCCCTKEIFEGIKKVKKLGISGI